MANLTSHTFNLQFLNYTYKKIFRFWKFDAFIRHQAVSKKRVYYMRVLSVSLNKAFEAILNLVIFYSLGI